MTSRFISPFYDVGSGIKPPSGAKLYFFETDGVTPKNTWSDQLATPTANANPVVADSFGVFGNIYISGAYKVTLDDKNDTQIYGLADVEESGSAGNAGGAIMQFDQVINESITIATGSNALSISPTVAAGVVVTVPVSSTYVIL